MQLSNDSYMSESNIQHPTKNEQQKYKKIKVLGEGSMGKVYLVECPLQNNKLYVMKRINIGHLQAKEKQQALLQAQLHNMVRHENIIAFKEIYHTTKDKLCIIMEYAEGGDLDELLKNLKENKRMLTEEEILRYFAQICLGLREIHEKKIVHRDLKGANIFLGQDGKIKIGDFGISKAMDRTVLASKSFVGTPFYLSPEMVEGKPYSTKADIWALGVILYHMTALKLPFDANSLPVLALKILKGSYPQIPSNAYSKDLKNLISSMLQVDQKKRPSVNQILCKPIITKYLPRQFVMMVTPKIQAKIQAKVQLKVEKIKMATTKSKKQLKEQNEKMMTEEQKKRKRQEDKFKREQQRKKMRDDIKNKRLNPTANTTSKQADQIQVIQKTLQVITTQTVHSAQIPKKQPPKVIVRATVSSNKNIKEAKQEKQKSSQKHSIEKPWKNKNMPREKKQPEIQIVLPGHRRKSLPQIQQAQSKPLLKSQDFDVQIFVQGQNPYRQNAQQQPPTQHKKLTSSPIYNNASNFTEEQEQSNLLPANTESSSNNSMIERLMENKSYADTNLQDLLANVQRAQFMVSNLHNPYEKNDIELYQESADFDNTNNFPDYANKKVDKGPKKFENNESDIENMKYITNITDNENLQELRQILQDRLGEQGFIKAYNIVKEHFEEMTKLKSSAQDNNDTQDSEAYLFNRKVLKEKLGFLSKEQFQRNIQLLYTISVMEDIQMMKNFDQSSEEYEEEIDEDEIY